MATWPRHVILFVVKSNDISLSPLIALTYCFAPDGSPFWYTKPHSFLVGNWFSTLHCWETHKPLSHLLKSPPGAIPSLSYCSFDSYSPISRLLGLDLSSSRSVRIWITPQSLAIDKGLHNRTSLGWHLRWKNVTPLQNVGAMS